MASRALLPLRAPSKHFFITPQRLILHRNSNFTRKFSAKAENGSPLESPDLPRLAETARITLTPQEVEEFAPKIQQVIDWFGQLQAVDLNTVEPALRAETEGDNLRDDIPETFEKTEPIISGVPSYEEPYIKVPKVLNKSVHFAVGCSRLNGILDSAYFRTEAKLL